jgi:hypothetical protein
MINRHQHNFSAAGNTKVEGVEFGKKMWVLWTAEFLLLSFQLPWLCYVPR